MGSKPYSFGEGGDAYEQNGSDLLLLLLLLLKEMLYGSIIAMFVGAGHNHVTKNPKSRMNSIPRRMHLIRVSHERAG